MQPERGRARPPPSGRRPRHTTRRVLLRGAAALTAVLGARVRSRRHRAGGGLLVLVADDTSRLNIRAYGDPVATTPNVDRLAAEGTRFERAYTTTGLCEPSRASMYTGLYPCAHGATGFDPIRPGVATCPGLLAPAGVATGLIGKVHVEPVSDFPFEFLATGDAFLKERSAVAFTGAFEDFLRRAGKRPFTCFVNFKDPHRPFHDQEGPDLGQAQRSAPQLHAPEAVRPFPFLWDTPETRDDLARFYDALARMDETLGRLLDALAASGRAEDTLVVFTSDNGMPFPYAKATLYEAGINLPFVVRWPGVVAPGARSTALVGLVDLVPTALELFGLSPRELHGRSLLPLLRGEVASVREEWFAMHTSQKVGEAYPSRSLRAGDHKYVRNLKPEASFHYSGFKSSPTWRSWRALLEGDEPAPAGLAEHMRRLQHRPAEELYDLAEDPFEQRDLLRAPELAVAHAGTLEDLRARMARQMRALDDRAGLELLAASATRAAAEEAAGPAAPEAKRER